MTSCYKIEEVVIILDSNTEFSTKEKQICYPAVRCLWAFVWLHVSQFNRPLIVKLLNNQSKVECFHEPLINDQMKDDHVTNLFFGHVQKADRVPLALEVGPDGVQGLVKLSLNVRQLFKHFARRP